jgi:DNA polymerase eta
VLAHVATYADGETTPSYHPLPSPKTHKVSLDSYRRASASIFSIIARFCPNYERASIDEAFFDLTEESVRRLRESHDPSQCSPQLGLYDGCGHVIGSPTSTWGGHLLVFAAELTQNVRAAICDELNFTCSAGTLKSFPCHSDNIRSSNILFDILATFL